MLKLPDARSKSHTIRTMDTKDLPAFLLNQFGFDGITAAQIFGVSPLLYKRLISIEGTIPLRVVATLSCLMLAQREAPNLLKQYALPTISTDDFLIELRQIWPDLSTELYAQIVGRTLSSAYRWRTNPIVSMRSFRVLVGLIRGLLESVEKDQQIDLLKKLADENK